MSSEARFKGRDCRRFSPGALQTAPSHLAANGLSDERVGVVREQRDELLVERLRRFEQMIGDRLAHLPFRIARQESEKFRGVRAVGAIPQYRHGALDQFQAFRPGQGSSVRLELLCKLGKRCLGTVGVEFHQYS